MTVAEIMETARGLVGKERLTPYDKESIESMYLLVLRKTFKPTPCNDCYRDAAILIYNYLKNNGKMKEATNYELKRGVLLQMEFGSARMYTNANLTDEVAEEFLHKNPDKINWFAKMPDDWMQRAERRQIASDVTEQLEQGADKEKLTEEVSAKRVNGRRIGRKAAEEIVNDIKG